MSVIKYAATEGVVPVGRHLLACWHQYKTRAGKLCRHWGVRAEQGKDRDGDRMNRLGLGGKHVQWHQLPLHPIPFSGPDLSVRDKRTAWADMLVPSLHWKKMWGETQQCKPTHVYSEVNPTALNGISFWSTLCRIVVQDVTERMGRHPCKQPYTIEWPLVSIIVFRSRESDSYFPSIACKMVASF